MSKRFTANDKWEDVWFRKLNLKAKLFWFFILDKCDIAGIWKKDFELASFYIGEKITGEILKDFEGRIQVLDNDKLWIVKFVEFQYSNLDGKSNLFNSVRKELEKYNLLGRVKEGLNNPSSTGTGTGTGTDKGTGKGTSVVSRGGVGGKCENNAKIKYLNFVFLTKDEYNKLVRKYGEDNAGDLIHQLNNHIGSEGRDKYASHYYTLLKWARHNELEILEDITEPAPPQTQPSSPLLKQIIEMKRKSAEADQKIQDEFYKLPLAEQERRKKENAEKLAEILRGAFK